MVKHIIQKATGAKCKKTPSVKKDGVASLIMQKEPGAERHAEGSIRRKSALHNWRQKQRQNRLGNSIAQFSFLKNVLK